MDPTISSFLLSIILGILFLNLICNFVLYWSRFLNFEIVFLSLILCFLNLNLLILGDTCGVSYMRMVAPLFFLFKKTK